MKALQFTSLALILAAATAFAQSDGDKVTASALPPNTPIATPASGAGIPEIPIQPTAGETKITLEVGFGIRYVPPSHVSVPVGERLTIVSPFSADSIPAGATITWLKNGEKISSATSGSLVIERVTSSDAGLYVCQAPLPSPVAAPLFAQALVLGVGQPSRLLNVSTRGTLAAGAGQSFVTGFVVSGGTDSGKKIILRAIGPTLARFGIEKPLAKPVLRIFDSTGKPYENGYAYPAVVGGPSYDSDLADSLASVGAFPTPPGSADAVLLMPFLPGSYTAQVTSADNGAGEVLIEIYEVP